jgi:diacylglycerol kinase (ATP)
LTKNASIIVNPNAGRLKKDPRSLDAGLAAFEKAGWNVRVEQTNKRGDATEIAASAARSGAEVVVVAGGDGTINEAVQGLVGTATALAPLPLGTVNVWSREVGFSPRVGTAAQQIISGCSLQVDTGRVDGHAFLLMAGIGFDAHVADSMNQRENGRRGVGPALFHAARALPRYRGASAEIDIDGRVSSHDVVMILTANTRLYGGAAKPAGKAIADDGMLDIHVFTGRGPIDVLRHVPPFLFGHGGIRGRKQIATRGKEIRISATPSLTVQVDGEAIGRTPVCVTVVASDLTVIVPQHYQGPLFGGAG